MTFLLSVNSVPQEFWYFTFVTFVTWPVVTDLIVTGLPGLPQYWKTLGSKDFLGISSTNSDVAHSCLLKLGQLCLGAKADLDQVVEIKTIRAYSCHLLQLMWYSVGLRISVTWVQIPMGAFFSLILHSPFENHTCFELRGAQEQCRIFNFRSPNSLTNLQACIYA